VAVGWDQVVLQIGKKLTDFFEQLCSIVEWLHILLIFMRLR
jgi:hypothetical protein